MPKLDSLSICFSNRPSLNSASSKQPNAGVSPRSVRTNLELCRDEADDDTEPRLAREVEPGLSIALHLGERITAGEKLGEDVVAAESRIGEIADPLRRLEGVARERTACRGVPDRRLRKIAEGQVDASLQAIRSMLLYLVQPELAETEAPMVVAEI